ncbi:MAG: hypothetical protein M1353_12785 [Nitrospirae bacterium]|nr:hypothetical protein [Nitrospirota bacterium]
MIRDRNIRQIQRILFMRRLYAYLLVLKYVQLLQATHEEKDHKQDHKAETFKYDPFGRRIEKRIEEQDEEKTEIKTYSFVYDNEDIILEYLTDAPHGDAKTKTTRYVHGLGIDEPLAINAKGDTRTNKGAGSFYLTCSSPRGM